MNAVRLYLIGFMGAGKSTLGRKVAERAGMHFVDLDELIEQRAGAAPAAIFAQHGEENFRQLEREALESTATLPDGRYLIACGGGAPCFGDNLSWMRQHGFVLYLRQSPVLLIQRLLQYGAPVRPLLAAVAPEQRAAYIRSLLEAREPYYLQADVVLEGEDVLLSGLNSQVQALLDRI